LFDTFSLLQKEAGYSDFFREEREREREREREDWRVSTLSSVFIGNPS
jgi:hypothetical protein